jgi:hypothetical protein
VTADQLAELARNCPPADRRQLWLWCWNFLGVRIATQAVCADHTAPFDLVSRQFFEPPSICLWHGPRGSGKSFNSAIDTHTGSRFVPRLGTKILGGSKAQSEQIYQALRDILLEGGGPLGADHDTLAALGTTQARYRNGSTVSILAASSKAVRGPHVQRLKLDEVDEMDKDVRESSIGMAMELRGARSSILMTSTWHRTAGSMAELMEQGRAGAFPVDTYCVFEVLERCPETRSGPELEHCPECPIMQWCHADMGSHPSGVPKAKRSNGHYTIDSLIQKTAGVSPRVFGSDYLCTEPKAAGIWFTTFEEALHVNPEAEFRPGVPVHITVDPGVCCGAVGFQVRRLPAGVKINVFADYFAEYVGAEDNARAILKEFEALCGIGLNRWARVSMDPSGNARTVAGFTVRGEFERAGLRGRLGLEGWPGVKKSNGLLLVEAFLLSADKTVSLTIHPRCKRLIQAFKSYARAKRAGQWEDVPEDPQHPHEDLIDPLCGGLLAEFPDGRAPEPNLNRVHARRVF